MSSDRFGPLLLVLYPHVIRRPKKPDVVAEYQVLLRREDSDDVTRISFTYNVIIFGRCSTFHNF